MLQHLIQLFLGLISGLFLGITGVAPTGLILIALDNLKIGDYKSNLGAILMLNLFPVTISSVYEFYKSDQINYSLAFILIFSIMTGSYFGSKMVIGKNSVLNVKNIKYLTGVLSLFAAIVFLTSAYYENNT
jgi:uncharacterized membrane protein YfcA